MAPNDRAINPSLMIKSRFADFKQPQGKGRVLCRTLESCVEQIQKETRRFKFDAKAEAMVERETLDEGTSEPNLQLAIWSAVRAVHKMNGFPICGRQFGMDELDYCIRNESLAHPETDLMATLTYTLFTWFDVNVIVISFFSGQLVTTVTSRSTSTTSHLLNYSSSTTTRLLQLLVFYNYSSFTSTRLLHLLVFYIYSSSTTTRLLDLLVFYK
ncbi:hypothetical protein GQ43DRAFT_429806 [Delitschia confertaspora ATCC 74209]|uniref:Uncharacterized protein n=1 Tax=Delitschia confertaspora ATCC 74209 TaxID=1513339 RepID=A0A9P4JQU6_9PLEO|nr:hypothetical protein GQ43DRAFT_429806 [Delitschia confertaspora ATCC 74209]